MTADNEKLIEEAERGNRAIEARDHRSLFEAAERERLIAEAATAILASEGIEPQEDGTYWGDNTWPNAVKDAGTALAVFEKAHTPTDDEREALIALKLASFSKRMSDGYPSIIMRTNEEAADLVLAAGFRRSEVPEPNADVAQVLSWIDRTLGLPMYQTPALTDYADAVVTTLTTVRKMLNGTTRPDASWRTAEPHGEPSSEVPEPSAEERDLIDTANQMRRQTSSGIKPGSLIGLWLRTASALEARIKRPSEPQGEPSDAQVEAALIAHLGYDPAPAGFPFKDDEKDQMRAALRAAEEAKR